MKLNLQACLVAAICQFKASSDIRYYLNGVFIEPISTGGALIVATNGHTMGIWRDTTAEIERATILRISKRLESACAGADTKRLKIIDDRLVVVDKSGFEVYVQHHVGAKPGNWEILGTYPNWRRVVPKVSEHGLRDSLNPAYVACVDRALSIGSKNGWSGITFSQSERGSSILVMGGATDFVGIIMPIRDEDASYPKWLECLNTDHDLPLSNQQPSDAAPIEEEVTA